MPDIVNKGQGVRLAMMAQADSLARKAKADPSPVATATCAGSMLHRVLRTHMCARVAHVCAYPSSLGARARRP